jgi:hypothetical protein
MRRLFALAVCLLAVGSLGAQHRTTNFVVYAADPQVAQLIGQWAEHYRKEKALVWLNHEMPNWSHPCPLHVDVNMQGPSGATSFQFGQGAVLSMKMEIQGPLERLVHSVLPHEITHTVFAYHFKCPVPRWADEGGSVLSEDDVERQRHDQLVRGILNRGQQIPLRTLLGLTQYPNQVMCLYAQGFSMTDFLVKRSNRQHFLNFVGRGMQAGWDRAAKEYYGHDRVEELEQAWLTHLRDTRRQNVQLAQNTKGTQPVQATPTGRTVRLTVPPAQPLEPQPTVRAAAPSPDQVGQRFGETPRWQPVTLQPPVPESILIGPAVAPPPARAASRSSVQLLPPQTDTPTQVPRGASPVGFPRQ